jgi:hypothetical protein
VIRCASLPLRSARSETGGTATGLASGEVKAAGVPVAVDLPGVAPVRAVPPQPAAAAVIAPATSAV